MGENELDIKELITKLFGHKKVLIIAFFVPVVVSLIMSLLLTKKYTSYAEILSPEIAAGGSIIQTPFGGFSASGIKGNILTSSTVIALLKSDIMLEDVIDHFDLMEKMKVNKKRKAIKILKEEITNIKLMSDEGIIKISVETTSPKMSKSIIEFYISNLEKLNKKLELSSNTPVVSVISPPFTPVEDSFPNTKKNILISGFLGFIIGVLYIYIKEKFQKDV